MLSRRQLTEKESAAPEDKTENCSSQSCPYPDARFG